MIEPEFKPGTLVSRTCALSTGQCLPPISFLPNPRAYDILDSDLYRGSLSQPAATFGEVAGWGLFIQELKEVFCYAKVSDGKCVRVPVCIWGCKCSEPWISVFWNQKGHVQQARAGAGLGCG